MFLFFLILPFTASMPQSRQLTAETCEVTDFEEKKRQECEEVSETECRPVVVTKFRTELVRKCKTFTDQRCNVTYTEVPRQACRAVKEKVCHIEFALVEEVRYGDEVCDTSVQNFCEEPLVPPPPDQMNRQPRGARNKVGRRSENQAPDGSNNSWGPQVPISEAALSLFFPNQHQLQSQTRHRRQAPPPPPARVTITEVAAPPGCRSLATTSCRALPRVTTVKVPQEKCRLEPSVVCDIVLKKVPELTCVPEVLEECNDFPKEIPFLVDELECEEVVFDECVEVSEKIPVEVRTSSEYTTL